MLSSLFEGISRDELIARMQEKREKAYIDKILSKMHELVQTDGDRQSLGGYAFDVGRMIGNAIHPKELEQMYRKKYMNESKINEWGRVVKGVNTTVDVGPNEIKTQAAKFGNSVTKDGVPPTTRTRVVKEEARYTAYEWSIIQGGHSLDDIKKPDPGLAIMEENFRIFSENFKDGKKPGRKGLAKRSGVNTKASVSSLRKTAKSSSGEKQRMAHWLANMKSGKSKAKKK